MKQAPSLNRGRFCGAAAATLAVSTLGPSSFYRPIPAGLEPTAGSHLVTPRWGYTHHGIYVGRGKVVQYGGLSGALHRGPVEEVDLIQFARGRPIWIRIYERHPLDREEICRRARSRLGEDRYHLLANNCEHFCEWCVSGKHCSDQVEGLVSHPRRALKRSVDLVADALRWRKAFYPGTDSSHRTCGDTLQKVGLGT